MLRVMYGSQVLVRAILVGHILVKWYNCLSISFYQGIDFSLFTGHMIVGIVFASIVGYGFLRFIYRKMQDLENKDPIEITGGYFY